jgi:flagellar hook-associated protein 3 FlgL
MSVASFSRLGTSNAYDNTVANLQGRQNNLSTLQEQLTSGKKITTPSDDPTGAAQAERALNRLARIATDQRALDAQRNAISQAEGTLADVTDVLQQIRDLANSAGNGSFSAADRRTVALQITGLRDRLIDLANTKDSNGQPLFAALGSALKPFVGPAVSPDYSFNGLAGSAAGDTYSIPGTLDGESAFMLQPGRDAAYNAQTSTGSKLTTDGVKLVNATAVPANAKDLTYTLNNMSVTGNTATYDLVTTDTSTNPTTVVGTQAGLTSPWSATLGFTVTTVPGVSFSVKGTHAASDSITLAPNTSVFATVDKAINGITNAANTTEANQAVSQALHNIDISIGRVAAIRGQAGDLLNRADIISANNDKRNVEQEANRSRAEDMDMIKGVSQFQNQQTGYQAALQSYAQIQKLSLFNFIS